MSARAVRATMVLLSVIGLGVASYLTYVHYSGSPILCLRGGGCETVQHSAYSKLAGVPVALIGLAGYVVILASLLAPPSERTRLGTMAFTVVGFGFSAYLTARELFSIHAICPWCVSSACIMTLLVGLAIWRFLHGEEVLHPGLSPASTIATDESTAPLGAARS
jgi:uncharacterized membrane protein